MCYKKVKKNEELLLICARLSQETVFSCKLYESPVKIDLMEC